ncbi:5-hydroxytryptamine receptor 3A-like [Pelmatolapia mariae]|uniref:5-hydroxytryptamine receptor 3A-like n=1 Tax=Pelmatolapia mariae TaxID=158779 RepID=UPI002FE506CC
MFKDKTYLSLWELMLTREPYCSETEKDKASPSPYLTIVYDGSTEFRNDQVVVSTCKMQVYKFPFDSQSCNLSFRSIMHDDTEIKLQPYTNETKMQEWSLDNMHTQYEWLYQNMSVVSRHDNFIFNQTIIVYTITMKRRSVLYIANFILPILFFLTLDLASFLISDTGGEKLSFKVTVLLAVTVMQFLLNEILPSSSDSIPLIAVYCIGIFTLMLLSLLETILVMHLIEKDSAVQDETDGDGNMADNYGVKEDNHDFQSFFRTQDIRLQPSDNSTEATEWSPDLMQKQYEWLFINMTVTANNASDLV